MFEKFNICKSTKTLGLYSGTLSAELKSMFPAKTVPTIVTPDGDVIGDSLAIAETLAEFHPHKNLWPQATSARVFARWIVSEMHSGFYALREDCPMQLIAQISDFQPSELVTRDLQRIEVLWKHAKENFGSPDSPWLFGTYSLADVFFAPVAARIAGYGLLVSEFAQAYVDAHLNDFAFRQWRALGLCDKYEPTPYIAGKNLAPWPGPIPKHSTTCEGPSINSHCPYSGDLVTDYLKMDGKIWGFCNPRCRDKTLHDPEAWPAFLNMVNQGSLS